MVRCSLFILGWSVTERMGFLFLRLDITKVFLLIIYALELPKLYTYYCQLTVLYLLAPMKGNLMATAHSYVSGKNPTCFVSIVCVWPFPFPMTMAHVHRASSMKKRFSQFGLEELDWPVQNPELNPIQHLWDELERRLCARPRTHLVLDLTNATEWEKISAASSNTWWKSLPGSVEAVKTED